MANIDKFIVCSCGCSEHLIRLQQFDWVREGKILDTDIGVSIHLSQHAGFFRRLWTAIKYVFGHRSEYGDFDEILLEDKDIDEIINFCEEYKKSKAEALKSRKES